MLAERKKLEIRAAAILELQRREKEQLNKDKTTYGIVSPTDGLLRVWQESEGKYLEVDKPPVVLVPEKLEPLITTYKPIVIIEGGRGSAKSETVASIVTARVKDYGIKVGCFREYQNSISDSVHSIIKKKIVAHQFTGFDPLDSKIEHENDGSLRFRGLARNPEGVKSMDGFNTFWVEEAQTISARSLELLEPTLRESNSQLIYTLNRGSSADPISKEHLNAHDDVVFRDGYYEDDQVMIIRVNYPDNPWFPDVLEGRRRKNKREWSRAKYDHVWNGQYNDEVENSIIKAEWFDAAIDAHIKLGFKPKGFMIASHDPSDTGDDAKGYALRHGSVVLDVDEKKTGDVNEGCDWAAGKAIQAGADLFTWDCDGLGVSLNRQVDEAFKGKKIDYQMFKGSESPDEPEKPYQPPKDGVTDDRKIRTNEEVFRNKRAQYYTRLANRFYATYRAVEHGEYIDPDELISLSSAIKNMTNLRSELCRIPLKDNGNGYIQIMTKKEMKLQGIKSPNMADSVMQLMLYPSMKKKRKPPSDGYRGSTGWMGA